jgi:hypothetical protein
MLADDLSTPNAASRRTALCNKFALPLLSRFRAPSPMLQKCLVQVSHTSLRVCTDGMACLSSFGDAKVHFLAGILLWHHQERKFGEGWQQQPR